MAPGGMGTRTGAIWERVIAPVLDIHYSSRYQPQVGCDPPKATGRPGGAADASDWAPAEMGKMAHDGRRQGMSLLMLHDIVKEYGTRTLLAGVSLSVGRGERVALVGVNGAGKTTLTRIALGLETSDGGRVTVAKGTKTGYLPQDIGAMAGGVVFDETAKAFEHVAVLERRLREIEALMSTPEVLADGTSLERLEYEYSRLTSRFESLDGYSVATRIKSTLMGLGLREEALTSPVSQLSGGERMRVALARVLLSEPDLLVLDEPTNHLDIPATEWLEDFLRGFGGGLLVISHDRYFLDQVATKVAELQEGKLVGRSGNYSNYLEQKRIRQAFVSEEKRRIEREIQRAEQLAGRLKGVRRYNSAHSRAKVADRLRNELSQLASETHTRSPMAPMLGLAPPRHVSNVIARVEGLRKRFGERVLFEDTGFEISGGERIGLIGPNGCGKTTLIRILIGQDMDFEGQVRLGPWVKCGYLGQEIVFMDERRTVIEEFLAHRDWTEQEARDYLGRFLFRGDDVRKTISMLSGGEKARLRIACLVAEEPSCLILDEPTNHLDLPAREALEEALLGFKGTFIAVSHDRYFLNRCVDRIFEIAGGKLNCFEGNYDSYRCAKAEASAVAPRAGAMPGAGTVLQSGPGKTARARAVGAARAAADRKAEAPRRTGDRIARTGKMSKAAAEELAAIEGKIVQLEQRMGELEASFEYGADYEACQEYEGLVKELDVLYEAWIGLSEGEPLVE